MIEQSQQQKIESVFNSIRDLVLEKNKRYGDIALTPLNIFSNLNSTEGILQRLDDKLSRVKNSTELRKNDIADIVGYLSLLCVSKEWLDFKEFID